MAELLAGTQVLARGLRWEVVQVINLGQQALHRLRGLDGAVQGLEFDLLVPLEAVEPVRQDLCPERAAPLPNWRVYHQAFLLEQALGSDALLAVQPGRLRLEPYQLVPVLRALRMSRVRLLLADGVGLGKTIQAGLVLSELIARRLAHRILVVSPAGPLLEQWRTEMSERFGLRLDVIDRARLEEIRRANELGANPFDHLPLGLISLDFLKQDNILDQLARASYDVVVLDEAHHCAEVGTTDERDATLRRRCATVLARCSDSLLLLTATPHDGNDRSFASLCELLDPSLVDGQGVLRGDQFRQHVIRRLKPHIKNARGEPLFQERRVIGMAVRHSPTAHARFADLHRQLLALVAPELRRAFKARSYSDVLAYLALLKRSVSTVAALATTLEVVNERLSRLLASGAERQDASRERQRTLREYYRRIERFGALNADEESEHEQLEAEDLASQLAGLQRDLRSGTRQLARMASVIDALEELRELATAAADQDPKLQQLVATIRELRAAEPGANVLVYTEYTRSQEAALTFLRAADIGPLLSMSGSDDETTRRQVTERFRTADNLVLVSTDAAAEGLNLHQRCHHLIHLELPFNPNRLEQRNGRIDRYGQTHEPVIRYLYLAGTFEERILLRLIAKWERQRARLTHMPDTLGLTVSTDAGLTRLLKPMMDEDAKLFQAEEVRFSPTEDHDDAVTDEATRELLEEIEHSLRGFQEAARTHSWLAATGLNADDALLRAADQARTRGGQVGGGDLAPFVRDALLLHGGEFRGAFTDDVFIFRLPPGWDQDLKDLPGYDSATRELRLTTKIDVTRDPAGRQVGFLGRAHPLVRRALDRVRHLAYGADAATGQDLRVSAVAAAVPVPTLLCTFLAQVHSTAGRELEVVLAATVAPDGTVQVYPAADQWLALARQECALRTTADLWQHHFAAWAPAARDTAAASVRAHFAGQAEHFSTGRRASLHAEQENQDAWLRLRATEICTAAPTEQPDLFAAGAAPRPATPAPAWRTVNDPASRLAAFGADAAQSPARRAEADSALRLYSLRRDALHARLQLAPPEIVPLGLLMLLPEATYGA